MVKKKCKQCGKPFEATRKQRKYCSRECAYVALRKQWYNAQDRFRGKKRETVTVKTEQLGLAKKETVKLKIRLRTPKSQKSGD